MKTSAYISFLSLTMIGALCATHTPAAPVLGSDAASFAVLGATTVTNVPTSTIIGSAGTWSSSGAHVGGGFESSDHIGSSPQVSGAAAGVGVVPAQGQFGAAMANSGGATSGNASPGGRSLAPDNNTPPAETHNPVVRVINTGPVTVGSSATNDSDTDFIENVVAANGITLEPGITDLCGNAHADGASVPSSQNSHADHCAGNPISGNGLSGVPDVPTTPNGLTGVSMPPLAPAAGGTAPEPATILLLGLGLAGLAVSLRRSH